MDRSYNISKINKSVSKQAANWTILKDISKTVLGLTPKVVGVFSTVQTVYSCAKNYDKGLKASTVVSNVEASYVVHYATEYTLCFVKTKGASKTSQILGYAGNYSSVAVTSILPKIVYEKTHVIAKNIVLNKKGTIASPKYSSGKWDFACKYYNNYKNGIHGDCHFNLHYQNLKLNDNIEKRLNIPRPNYGF